MIHSPLHNQNDRLIRMPDVETLTGLRRSRIYELIQQQLFPRQVRVVGSALWSFSEIQQWIADRKADRDNTVAA